MTTNDPPLGRQSAPSKPTPLDQYLTTEQRQRALAAREARVILKGAGLTGLGTGDADPLDIWYIAEWIITGEDPWDDDPGEPDDPEAAAHRATGTHLKPPPPETGPVGVPVDPDVFRSAVADATGKHLGHVHRRGRGA